MGRAQYEAYNTEFGLRVPIRPPASTRMEGIGGAGTALEEARIQIPFMELGLIIDINFSILEEDATSLLSNENMLDNRLDISLQGWYLHIESKCQPLSLEKYSFVRRCTSNLIPFFLVIKVELRRFHKGFGHPSVKATFSLLKWASEKSHQIDTMSELKKIYAACIHCKHFLSTQGASS